MPKPALIAKRITDILATANKHDWTLGEMRATLNAQGVSTDQSTVYRSLLLLQRTNKVRRLATTANEYHFELTTPHHDHALCSFCGSIREIPCLSPQEDTPSGLDGFQVLDHQLTLAGICEPCKSQQQ